jgi:hypothetical protein
MAKRECRFDVAFEARASWYVRSMQDGRRRRVRQQPGSPPHARLVEVEYLQTLVDPARTGNRAAARPARTGRRVASEREDAIRRRVPFACEQLCAWYDCAEGALVAWV